MGVAISEAIRENLTAQKSVLTESAKFNPLENYPLYGIVPSVLGLGGLGLKIALLIMLSSSSQYIDYAQTNTYSMNIIINHTYY